jgi:hypothetical protein
MRHHKAIFTIILTLFLALAFFTQAAQAQTNSGPTGFKNVNLWVYPEYDDPRLLVILQGQITGVNPPTLVSFLVPSQAEMNSAGSMDAQGNYSGGPPDRKSSQISGWDEISYELKTDTFRVEYYDPVITSQPDKQISYDFRYLYPISDLKVVIQEPTKSTNFNVVPDGTAGTEGGFRVHYFSYSNLTADTPLHFDISYTKTDPNPSISSPSTTPAGSNSHVWIFVTVGIIALAGTGAYVVKSSKKAANVKTARSKAGQAAFKPGRPHKTRFCNQCGSSVEDTSNFCSKCGYKLKKSK